MANGPDESNVQEDPFARMAEALRQGPPATRRNTRGRPSSSDLAPVVAPRPSRPPPAVHPATVVVATTAPATTQVRTLSFLPSVIVEEEAPPSVAAPRTPRPAEVSTERGLHRRGTPQRGFAPLAVVFLLVLGLSAFGIGIAALFS